jgi:FkbM family methyltransferase
VIIGSILRYRKIYKNYISVGFAVIRKKPKILCRLRDQGENFLSYLNADALVRLVLDYSQDLKETANLLAKDSFRFHGHTVYLKGDPDNGAKIDVFFREEYRQLDVKGKSVVDIGANVGDTPIYFALNGAERVIALEPYPFSYKLARENIEANGLSNTIILMNSAYGIGGYIQLKDEQSTDRTRDLHLDKKASSNAVIVDRKSLRDLINTYRLESIVLKVDCEGCEYNLLEEDDHVFEKIEAVQIEYHYGYESLVDKLMRLGFEVTHTEGKKWHNKNATDPEMQIGFIYAKRNRLDGMPLSMNKHE